MGGELGGGEAVGAHEGTERRITVELYWNS